MVIGLSFCMYGSLNIKILNKGSKFNYSNYTYYLLGHIKKKSYANSITS